MMAPAAEVFLQWKGTDACYDFWCPCDGTGEDRYHGHRDGEFRQQFTCDNCGRTWQLPARFTAVGQ
jgi:transposase-like protein